MIGKAREINERQYFKKRTQDPKYGTYLDQYCNTRLISDDSLVFIRRNVYGEIEMDYENGRHRNLSQEEYDSRPGTVTQLAGYYYHNKNHYFCTAIGFRYKDRTTGDIYVIRQIKTDKRIAKLDVERNERDFGRRKKY